MKKEGKLIVIEGGDGSGKGTQTALLIEYLKNSNIEYLSLDFPIYESFYGQMVASYLRGEYGSIKDVSPYLASLLFALDRREMKAQINDALQSGRLVVANRYVCSNRAHQGSKFSTNEERKIFFDWLGELEYHINGIPRENLVLYLRVPWQAAAEMTSKKSKRSYLNGESSDIHEKDKEHRKNTERVYDELAKSEKTWTTIECTNHGTILSKEKIHSQILKTLLDRNIIP